MKNKHLKIIIATLFIIMYVTSLTYASGVEGDLVFKPEAVYYQDNTVVIYGTLTNETNKYIPYVNWMRINVYSWNGNNYELVTSGLFEGFYVYLAPGVAKNWTFRIYNSPIRSLSHWWVQYAVNYYYQDFD